MSLKISRKSAGYSLVEMMIGVGILSVCIVVLAMLLTNALHFSQRGVDYSAGAAVADLVMERYLKDNPYPSPLNLPEVGKWSLNKSSFDYSIGVAAVDADLVKVTVTIQWWGPGAVDKPFELKVVRLIYVNKSPLT